MKTITQIVFDVLIALGYDCVWEKTKDGNDDISFPIPNGQYEFMEEDKEIVRLIAKENLIEFYCRSRQHIYLKS